jgi:hypothetical protein
VCPEQTSGSYLPLLTRPETIVRFFHDVHHVSAITKQVWSQRTDDYAARSSPCRESQNPMEWPKRYRQEGYARPVPPCGAWNVGISSGCSSSSRASNSDSSLSPAFPVDDPNLPHGQPAAFREEDEEKKFIIIRECIFQGGRLPFRWMVLRPESCVRLHARAVHFGPARVSVRPLGDDEVRGSARRMSTSAAFPGSRRYIQRRSR